MSISEEIAKLARSYAAKFGSPPPVHEYLMDVAPSEALEMIRKALDRGSPITSDDYPRHPPGVVY